MTDQVVEAPSPEKNPPVVRLDLTQEQAKALSGTKPGDVIRLKIKGKLTSIELREPYTESKEKYVGYLRLEIQSMEASGQNVFDDLAEDD